MVESTSEGTAKDCLLLRFLPPRWLFLFFFVEADVAASEVLKVLLDFPAPPCTGLGVGLIVAEDMGGSLSGAAKAARYLGGGDDITGDDWEKQLSNSTAPSRDLMIEVVPQQE